MPIETRKQIQPKQPENPLVRERQKASLEPPFASGALNRDARKRFLEMHAKRSSELARKHNPPSPRRFR